eukprot:gene392-252_t
MQRKSLDDITFSTPEASFAVDAKSPQVLIKRFLDANLPNFPSISVIEESHFTQDDTSMHSDASDPSVSVSLSLPESFEVGLVQGQNMALGVKPVTSTAPAVTRTREGVPIPMCTQCLILKHHYEEKLHKLKQTYADADRQLTASSHELQQARRLAGLAEGGLRQELKLTEDRCNRLNELLQEETARRAQSDDRAKRCDEAERRARDLQEQVRVLNATVDQQRAALQSLTTHESQSQRSVDDLDRLNRLLQADKQHLTAAVATAESRLQSSREIQDREIAILREARQQTEQELTLQRRKGASLEQQVQEIHSRLLTEQQQRIVETSDLRAEIKLRTFEVTQLGATFESKANQLREATMQTEKLQAEVAAHRTALSRLEMESQRERDLLQVEIKTLTERLKAYEALEVEVDQAVLRVAATQYRATPDSPERTSPPPSSSLLLPYHHHQHPSSALNDIRGIPSHPESRMRQAVFLAQRLLHTEQQRDDALQRLDALTAQLHSETAAKQLAEDRLKLAAQPAVYLVNKLREEETLRVQYADRITVLTQQVQQWQRGYRKVDTENQQLRERLTLVLRQRGELETIKVMLHHLHYMQEHGSDDDEDDASSSSSDEEEPTDELAKKLLPWRPSHGDGEIEFELSSTTMEPERHAAVAESLGLPAETLQQLLKARMAGPHHHSNSSRSSSHHNSPKTASVASGSGIAAMHRRDRDAAAAADAAYDEAFEEAPGGDEDDDPEMIPLGYVRPEDH